MVSLNRHPRVHLSLAPGLSRAGAVFTMRGSATIEAQRRTRRERSLASFPTQCLLAAVLSIAVLAGAWGTRCVVYRVQCNRLLSAMSARALELPSPLRGVQAGPNAADLWLQAVETLRGAAAGGGEAESLRIVGRAAALRRCEFAHSPCGRAVGDPLTPLSAAAAMGPLADTGRGPERYGLPSPTGPGFPEGDEIAALSGLLGSEAAKEARAGNMELAAERLREGFVLSRHLCQGADASGVLCAAALDGAMVGAAARVLSAGNVPLAQARRLSSELSGLDHTAALLQGLQAQRQWLLCGTGVERCDGPQGVRGRLAQAVDGLRGGPQARVLQALADLECAEGILARPWGDVNPASTQLPVPRAGQIAATRIAVCAHDATAYRSLLQAALAVQCYRAKHGKCPEALADANADGLAIPPDVYGGEPLVYKVQGKGFSLRSVGFDLTEDPDGSQVDDIIWVSG